MTSLASIARRRGARLRTLLVTSAVVLGAAAIAHANVDHTWSSGDTLAAADLNQNFASLDQRLTTVEGAKVIQNGTAQQANASFNISGDGALGGKLRAQGVVGTGRYFDLTGSNLDPNAGPTDYLDVDGAIVGVNMLQSGEADFACPANDLSPMAFAFSKKTGAKAPFALTPLMTIAKTGNVGIGTSNPSTGLMVTTGNLASLAKGTGFLQVGDDTTPANLNLALDYGHIQARNAAGQAASLQIQGNGGDLLIGKSSNVYISDDTGTRYGRLAHTSQGNFHLDEGGGGSIFLSWYAGNGVNVGNGNQAYGAITAQQFNNVSDARLKTNVRTLDRALEDVQRLRGVRFDWKADGKASVGVIAQEIEAVYPEMVSTTTTGMKAVDYPKLTAVLIESTKELKRDNDALRARLDRLEALVSKRR